ncbi:MAG: MMPL family transporter [Pirellulales bacterium]|nr:MMPL family transporter [Pirellulales bacterium]
MESLSKQPDFHRRYATLLLLGALLCLPLVIWGTIQAYQRTDNSIDQWLPKNCPATDGYAHFRRLFGSDETILVSWEGCTLEDPRLEQFALAVEGKGSPYEILPALDLVEYVTTGQRAFQELRSEPLSLSRKLALQRLQGVLIGPDQRTTCAVVTLAAQTPRERAAVVDAIERIAVGHCHVATDELRLTGDAVISVAIDIEGEQAVDRLIWISALLALGVAWACLRSVKLAVLVFLLSQFCQAIAEAVVYYTGGTMNLLVSIVPVLVYVLSVSASVHLLNYYRDAVIHAGPLDAPRKAIQAGWLPCLIAAMTTAVGLASLCVSHVLPVKHFGIYGSAGVLISFCVLMLLLPAATVKFPVVPRATVRTGSGFTTTRPARPLAAIVNGLTRRPFIVITLFGAAFIVSAAGLMKIETSVEPARFLPENSRWITDMNWYRQHVGPLASVEMVIGFNNDCQLEFADRMRVVRNIQMHVLQLDQVQGAVSCATFAPTLGPLRRGRLSLRQQIRQSVRDWSVLEHRDVFIDGRFLAQDKEWELWRIEIRVTSFANLDFEQFSHELDAKARTILDAVGVPRDAVRVTYTGGVPLVYEAQRELLHALLVSFAMALGLVTVIMALVLQSLLAGLLAMLPNIFPALATFGTMGWLGSMVDVGAMMTASIGLGIAVDDTLHFVTWFRRAMQDGASRIEAIHSAYRCCGAAMLHTTLIAGLALFVFFFSSFQPVSQFGLLMFLLLVAALVGDLLLLPALLATRLGTFFHREVPINRTIATSPGGEYPT